MPHQPLAKLPAKLGLCWQHGCCHLPITLDSFLTLAPLAAKTRDVPVPSCTHEDALNSDVVQDESGMH